MRASSAVRALCRVCQHVVPPANRGIQILAYHLVGAGTDSPVDLEEPVFRRQMDELASTGRVVTLEDALEKAATEGRPETESWLVLTFDDAYRNFLDVAFPILEKLEMPSTVYVPTGFIDGVIPGPLRGAEDLPPLSWQELRGLGATGLVGMGSHSVAHPHLPGLQRAELREELSTSRSRLEEMLGTGVEHFAYPRALWTRETENVANSIYRTRAVAGGRVNLEFTGRLSRVPVRRDGPPSVNPLIERKVWLEEWVADRWRRS